jgi:hypothetical protein
MVVMWLLRIALSTQLSRGQTNFISSYGVETDKKFIFVAISAWAYSSSYTKRFCIGFSFNYGHKLCVEFRS